ncbi:MAG: redoxin family protein [Prolixibacteraceae bacterium]
MQRIQNISLIILMFANFVIGQETYRIEVELPAAAGKQVLLANYYLGQIYAKDTVQLDEKGVGIFRGDSLLPQGMYKIFLDENNNFDFLLGADQQFQISGPSFSAEQLKVEGSAEARVFIEYVGFLKALQNRGAEIREKFKTAGEEEKEQLQTEMEGLTKKLHNRWEEIAEELPNSFLAKFVKANYVPALDVSTLPEEIQNNDSLLLRARFNFQRKHFWDNFDYTDERFLYTPFYKPKLETWFTKVLYQNYDSIKPYVFDFIEEVRPNKRIFQFVTSWFLNSSINSNVMGMDALFVDLAREYYLSGAAFWATGESMEKIEENLLFAKNNLIGMTAPDLTLENVDGEYVNLHQVDAAVTVVVIYEPDCSHCKVFVPEFHDKVYRQYKNKGLEVFAIYSMDDKPEWTEFLTKHNLYDWINVWDEHHVSRFEILYDARKTPVVYVLNENKEIVAKKMTVKQLEKYMERELN